MPLSIHFSVLSEFWEFTLSSLHGGSNYAQGPHHHAGLVVRCSSPPAEAPLIEVCASYTILHPYDTLLPLDFWAKDA